VKIKLDIYIPETSVPDADAHLSASVLLAWPEGRLVPRRGEVIQMEDLILEVTEVTHHLDDDDSDCPELTLATALDGPVEKDSWFRFIDESFRYSSYGLPGLILSMEKH